MSFARGRKRARSITPGRRYASVSMSIPRSIRARSITPMQRGYVRTGGYYGRYGTRALGGETEMKYLDTTHSFSIDATSEVPATGQVNLIPQGATEVTRVGARCIVRKIQTRLNCIFAPGAAATASGSFCIMIVLDRQCNGAAATFADVMTGAVLPNAYRNLANNRRFKVLKRWVWTMTAPAGVTTAYNNVTRRFEWDHVCRIPLEFSGATGAITEIKSNNIFLLAGTDSNNDDLVAVGGATRIRFTD